MREQKYTGRDTVMRGPCPGPVFGWKLFDSSWWCNCGNRYEDIDDCPKCRPYKHIVAADPGDEDDGDIKRGAA